MNPPVDPIKDNPFVEALRNSDRPVALKPAELTVRLTARRRRNRSHRVALSIAMSAGLVVIGLATHWMMSAPDSNPVPESVAQRDTDKLDEIAAELEVSQMELLTAAEENRELLAEKQEALHAIRKEIELLKQVKLKQEWALSRELISRTEIGQTMAVYGL